MFKDLVKISTKGMTREEWEIDRRSRKTIGGSEAGTVVGLNHFGSLYALWADKSGLLAPIEDNEAMRLGRDLEEYVAKRFTEATGKRVRRENAILLHPRYPFAHANLDRVIVGEDAVLECKTTSALNTKIFKSGEFPVRYYAQCVHYLMVFGAQRCYLAVLILGKEFKWYVLERDEEEIAALAEAEERFYNDHILTGIPPAPDGARATSNAIDEEFSDSNDETVDLGQFETLFSEYDALTLNIKALETQRDNIVNNIKEHMKEAGRGESASYSVSWRSQERRTFDRKSFEKSYASIDLSPFYKVSTSRTFRITKKEVS